MHAGRARLAHACMHCVAAAVTAASACPAPGWLAEKLPRGSSACTASAPACCRCCLGPYRGRLASPPLRSHPSGAGAAWPCTRQRDAASVLRGGAESARLPAQRNPKRITPAQAPPPWPRPSASLGQAHDCEVRRQVYRKEAEVGGPSVRLVGICDSEARQARHRSSIRAHAGWEERGRGASLEHAPAPWPSSRMAAPPRRRQAPCRALRCHLPRCPAPSAAHLGRGR